MQGVTNKSNMSKRSPNNDDDDDDRNFPFKKAFAPVKYKKAPNAPRRFKSSYMFFSTQKHKEIREERTKQGENPKQLSTTDVAKMVSQAWKDLSEEEREKWEEMGRKDKARYEMEKAMYHGPWKIPVSTKREKDPTRPKRPMSAFLSYSNRKRASVKEKHKNAKTADVSRILAQMWKDALPEEKQEFIDEEFRLRQDYKTAMAEWKDKAEKEFTKQREARESEAMKLVLEGKLPPDPFPLTSATSLPTGAEYNSRMAEETFSISNPGFHQQASAMAGNTGLHLGEGPSHASAAAAFQPPLDPSRRSGETNTYMYGSYMQPSHYPYPPHMYPGYPPQAYSQAPHAGNPTGSSAAPVDPQSYAPFPPYYPFDPNSPFRHPPY